MAASWLFIDPEWHDTTGPKVIEMLENIREAFASLVADITWMDQSTKLATLEKSKKMAYVISHPHWLFNQDVLNEYYEGVNNKIL